MSRPRKPAKRSKSEQPISYVAYRALRKRLKMVTHYAPLAVDLWQDEIEHVHQLRVATRRARAALHLYEDLFPKRPLRWMNRRLSELRRAAGNARDLDVLGQRLRTIAGEKQDSHLGAVVEKIAACRRKAQKPLTIAYKKAKRKGFAKRSRALAVASHWPGDEREPTFATSARARLSPLVDEFFAAAQADLSHLEALHQMRIAAKHVRYAVELLAEAFDEVVVGKLSATFAELQEKLGTINDHATAIVMLNDWFRRASDNESRAELAELIACEEKQLDESCQEFRQWWTQERATGLAEQFEMMLKDPALVRVNELEMPERPSNKTQKSNVSVVAG